MNEVERTHYIANRDHYAEGTGNLEFETRSETEIYKDTLDRVRSQIGRQGDAVYLQSNQQIWDSNL